MFDVLLRGATVVDGTGNPPRRADLAVTGDRIALIGEAGRTEARTVLDCSGLVLAPGFIDLHSHADFTIAGHPGAESYVRQGVTTIVTGNCGSSPFPSVDGRDAALTAIMAREGSDEAELTWPDFAGFASAIDAAGPAVNLAPMVGHAALRVAAAGTEHRELTAEELGFMRQLLADAAHQGAFGLSTGLIYAPGSFAATEEVVALATEAAAHDLLYSTHMRDEGDALLDAVDEAIGTARRSGVRLQVSHLKAMGPANHGKVADALRRIESARAEGIDVACDVYPYAASSTRLSSRLPNWALDGGFAGLVHRLRDEESYARIAAELTAKTGRTFLPEGTVLAALPEGPYSGRIGATLATIAAERGRPAAETALDILAAHEGNVWIVNHAMAESDVDTVLGHERSAIVSDGWVLDVHNAGHPHPRHFGTFARAIGRYHRDRGVLGLSEAVRKLTSLPAARIGLTDRGILAEGRIADITVFDPETITDTASYANPLAYARGTEHVLLGGRFALTGGEPGGRHGTVLRKSGQREKR
ncbi:N-acyl-D-amino-acid deacylase family protein [Sciscionella sediminilitoris]|uniref:N-acyl-D-amino-acid deacylase family protein n=1 Tax=Sciscionella sediminilitoris TaxID=1445613 RepID=UPI000B212F75|nr:D-aminoacylase [Sciscionella sp. SE31]